jgi:hypothetical protein
MRIRISLCQKGSGTGATAGISRRGLCSRIIPLVIKEKYVLDLKYLI